MIAVSIASDFDECSSEPSPCDENADCVNSDGSYSCTCKQGFTGNGAICEGVPVLIIHCAFTTIELTQLVLGFTLSSSASDVVLRNQKRNFLHPGT